MKVPDTDESEAYQQLQDAEERQLLSKRTKIVAVLAALSALVCVVLVVNAIRNSQKDVTKYTVGTSKYGVPEDCQDFTAICAENTETGGVGCSCGSYLFQWNGAEWVQS